MNANTDTATQATPQALTQAAKAPAKSPSARLWDELQATGALIFHPQESTAGFQEMMAEHFAGTDNVHRDWTLKAPESFEGLIFARTKNGAEYRGVAFADKATALNDANVQEACYIWYLRQIKKTARDPDATEGQFLTPSGALSMAYDPDSFKFQVARWLIILQARGLDEVRERSLKTACMSTAFASAAFPGFKEFPQVLEYMAVYAVQNGYSRALFDHWLAIRDGRKDEKTKIVTLGGMSLDDLLATATVEGTDTDDDDDDDTEIVAQSQAQSQPSSAV